MSVTAANEAIAGLAKKGQNEASGSGKMMSHPDVKIPSYIGKVITQKLRGEVYLVEQDTIESVFLAYSKFISKFPSKHLWFSHLYVMQLFSADTTIFLNEF